MRSFFRRLKGRAGTPAYGAGVALSGFLAACIGSVYSSEIKTAFPLTWPSFTLQGWFGLVDWRPNSWAIAFWCLASAWFVLNFLRQIAGSENVELFKRQAMQIGDGVSNLDSATKEVRQKLKTVMSTSDSLVAQSATLALGISNVESSVAEVRTSTLEVRTATGDIRSNVEATNKAVAATKDAAVALAVSIEDAKAMIGDLRTLPSKEFRAALATKSNVLYSLLATAFPRRIARVADPAQNAEQIRLMLAHLLDLRRIYEANDKGRYAANIMIFHQLDGPSEFAPDIVNKLSLFSPSQAVNTNELAGVLILDKQLSTSTDEPLGKPDENVQEIALGIPVEIDGSPWIIPGAAETFVAASDRQSDAWISGYHDTLHIHNLLTEQYRVPPTMLDKCKRYYDANRQWIRSFVTLPLYYPDLLPIGVVNIHSDSPSRFGKNKEPEANFGLTVMPLVNAIAETCVLWVSDQ